MEKFINLDKTNIDKEHICCAISDKKCKDRMVSFKFSFSINDKTTKQEIKARTHNTVPKKTRLLFFKSNNLVFQLF